MKTILRLILCSFLFLPSLSAEIPNSIPHQGRIAMDGVNFNGFGEFKFLLFADPDEDHASGNETAIWSNASTTPGNTNEPASEVSITVTKGLYSTWLGDTDVSGMAALPSSIEPPAGSRLYLRIWFRGDFSDPEDPDAFQALTPDQAIAAVPFALHANKVADGAVTAESIADGTITSGKLADGAVTSGSLADDAVTEEKIALGAVTQLGVPGQPGSITPRVSLIARDSDQTGLDAPISIAVQGNFAYVVDVNTSRIQIFDITNPNNIVPRDFDQTGMSFPTSVAVQGSFAYVVDAFTSRLQIFDISNPDGIVPRDFDNTVLISPRSVAVSGNFAYVLDGGTNRLQMLDISDPDNIVPRDFNIIGSAGLGSVAAAGNFVYVVDSASDRLQIFDTSDPNNIVPRDFDQTGMSNPTSVAVQGAFAYVVDADTDRLQIFDISDPDNILPQDFDVTGISNPTSVAIQGNFAYVVDADTDRLQIFDVSDSDVIVPLDFEQTGLSRPNSVASVGNFAYVVDEDTSLLQIFEIGTELRLNHTKTDELEVAGSINAGSMTATNLSVTGSITAASGSFTGSLTSNSTTSGAFSFTTPKAGAITIPGSSFLPRDTTEVFARSLGGYIFPTGADTQFVGLTPVQLPQGATITGMDVFYLDNGATQNITSITTRLRRLPMFSTNPTEQGILAVNVTTPTSGQSTNMLVASDSNPNTSFNVVDNQNFSYFAHADFVVTAPESSNLRFYGFRIRYTLTTIEP